MQYGGVIQSSDNVDALLPWVMACLEVVLNTIHMHAHECFPGEVPKEPLDVVWVDSLYSSANEEKSSGRKTLPKQTSFGGLGLSMETSTELSQLPALNTGSCPQMLLCRLIGCQLIAHSSSIAIYVCISVGICVGIYVYTWKVWAIHYTLASSHTHGRYGLYIIH